jgi:hypothetical protein
MRNRGLDEKRKIFKGFKRVVSMEKAWIKEVRYEFSIAIREEVFNMLKLHMKGK